MTVAEAVAEQTPIIKKHPGRVEQGKRLAALMKQRKEEQRKAKPSEGVSKASDEVSKPSDEVGVSTTNLKKEKKKKKEKKVETNL